MNAFKFQNHWFLFSQMESFEIMWIPECLYSQEISLSFRIDLILVLMIIQEEIYFD